MDKEEHEAGDVDQGQFMGNLQVDCEKCGTQVQM